MKRRFIRIMLSMLWLLIPAHFLSAQIDQNVTNNYLNRINNGNGGENLINDIEANTAQIPKEALILKAKINLLERKFQNNASNSSLLDSLEVLAENQQGISKNVIYAILAQYAYNYALQNMSNFANRAMLIYDKNDKNTWTWKNFIEKAVEYQEKSIEGNSVKNEKSENWDIFFNIKLSQNHNKDKAIQETLYDVLIVHLLKMYKIEYSYLYDATQSLQLSDKDLFAPVSEFIKQSFDFKDKKNPQAKIIKTFQESLSFNQAKANSLAFVEMDLLRLEYALSQSNNNDKIKLYEAAFNSLRKMHKNTFVGAYLDYKYFYYLDQNKANKDIEEIEAIVESIKNNPNLDSSMTSDIKQISAMLNKAYFNITLEPVALPKKPILLNIHYQYIDTLYYKVVKKNPSNNYKEYIANILNYPVVDSKHWAIAKTKIRKKQTTEVLLDSLESGLYYIIVSNNKDFSLSADNAIQALEFSVTNLAILEQKKTNYDWYGYLFDRSTGKALDKNQVKFIQRIYNYNTNNYTNKSIDFYVDHIGKFNLKNINPNELRLVYNNDTLSINNYNYNTSINVYNNNDITAWQKSENTSTLTHIFTDRAIYRPGQKVFIKGIMLDYTSNRIDPAPKVKSNAKQEVQLRDSKNNLIKSANVTTNEFGSFDVEFDIATQAQTGSFYIYVGNTKKEIKVEAYKRHQFYTTVQQDKDVYILGDSVKVNGKAMAYAGNALVGAKVVYTLKRDNKVIKDSTLLTDNKGEFIIAFLSEKDKTELPSPNEKHSYSIRLDVVDITGETHSNTIDLEIATVSKKIAIIMPEYIAKDAKIDIKISVENFNGNTIAGQGNIKIYKSEKEDKFYAKRIWEFPEVVTISKDVFEKSFPQYAYKIDNGKTNKTLISSDTFNTAINPYYKLSTAALSTGYYNVLITSKDKSGEDIISEKQFYVYKANEAIKTEALLIPQAVFTVGKDDKLTIPIYTLKPSTVLVEIQNAEGIIYTQLLEVNKFYNWVLPLQDKFTSTFKIHFHTLLYNRLYSKSVDVNVVSNSENLQIELLTFRDKMQGGEDETWKIKVTGKQGEKVDAELLATMYDASLDAFLSNSWILPTLNRHNTINTNDRLYIKNIRANNRLSHIGQSFAPTSYQHKVLNYANWSNGYNNYNNYYNNKIIFEDNTRLSFYFTKVTMNNFFNGYNRQNNNVYSQNYNGRSNTVEKDVVQQTHTAGSRSSSDDTYIDGVRAEGNSSIIEIEAERPTVQQIVITPDNSTQATRSITDMKASKVDIVNFMPVEPHKPIPTKVREDLHETVFFYPRVSQNEAGEYLLNFKMNDALTRWKFMLFAHDKNLNWATQEHFIVTQKELMIQPNAPRFLRQGDTILFPAKISNLTNAEMKGEAYLKLYNALTNEPLEHSFGEGNKVFPFYIKPQEVTVIQWRIVIPDNFHGVIKYEMIAKSANHTDGESNILPVLSNQTLVTKVLPIAIAQKGKTTYEFKEMKEVMANSNTVKNYEVSLNLNASSLYSALSSLNYLKAYPYNCSEQLFSIYYANVTGNYLIKNNPAVQQLYAAKVDKKSLASVDNLSASAVNIIEAEAAWLLGNKLLNSNLFNDEIVSKEIENIMNLLTSRQNADGGLSWYGGASDVYISQLWAKGMGEFIDKGMIKPEGRNLKMLQGAIGYLDNVFIGNIASQNSRYASLDYNYLYTRSFYEKLIPVSKQVASKRDDILKKDWKNLSLIDKIRLGIAAYNLDKKDLVQDLIKDIKAQIGVLDKFKNNSGYPYYYNTQELYAQLIELLFKVNKNDSWIDDLKGYLLKNKQGNYWGSTKTTTQVLYALFFYNTEETNNDNSNDLLVKIANENIDESELKSLSTYGVLNKVFDKVNPDFTKLEITNNKVLQPINGNLTWRYFENFDKISNEENAEIKKTLLIRKDGDKFEPWNENNPIKVGDLVRVRIEIKVKSALGYVHVKDMRAAGFEPIDVFSERKNIQNLSYYQAVSDAAMNFFIDNLNQGTYVLEYDLRATYKGNYNNGVTSIESMYAPEKTAYSKAIRLTIE